MGHLRNIYKPRRPRFTEILKQIVPIYLALIWNLHSLTQHGLEISIRSLLWVWRHRPPSPNNGIPERVCVKHDYLQITVASRYSTPTPDDVHLALSSQFKVLGGWNWHSHGSWNYSSLCHRILTPHNTDRRQNHWTLFKWIHVRAVWGPHYMWRRARFDV